MKILASILKFVLMLALAVGCYWLVINAFVEHEAELKAGPGHHHKVTP